MSVTTPGERYQSLDAIRGVAVMGILAMNIIAFALPFSAYSNPAAGGAPGSVDLATWFFNFVFVDSKMRGLFSMLFGASTLLVIERASAEGRSAAGVHYPRMVWLALFGLAHFYLFWFGDILFSYAICGLFLYLFRNFSAKALVASAIGFFIVGIGFFLFGWASMAIAQAGAMPPEALAAMREAVAEIQYDMGPNTPAYAADVALHLGSYADIAGNRLGEMGAMPFVGAALFFAETMGLMLIGMALFRAQMLTGAWTPARYRKWAITGFLLATPPLVALAFYQIGTGYDAVAIFGSTIALSAPFDIVMTIGWAALILWAIGRLAGEALCTRLAAAGRMAFTNYLGTTAVMTTIFYGYGLGLFGSVGRAALYLFCFAMWAAMLAWSKPWLDRFHYGPLEWLWRSLSRGSAQPMRKR